MDPGRRLRAVAVTTLAVVLLSLGLSAAPAHAASSFNLANDMNGKCLDVIGFDRSNGAYAGLWDCVHGVNQLWYWNGDELRSAYHHKCLEVRYFHNENGATAGLWDCVGGINQKWYTISTGYGRFQLVNKWNGKCLEITYFNNDNGAQAGMWDCWWGANQRWYDPDNTGYAG